MIENKIDFLPIKPELSLLPKKIFAQFKKKKAASELKEQVSSLMDRVDTASIDSFPASDPPAFNAGYDYKADHFPRDTR